MTQEQKDLLLKDISARLPYEVKISVNDKVETLEGISILENSMEYGSFLVSDIEEVKPYLFPISSITIEQEKELSKLGVSYCEYALHDDIRGLGIMVEDAYIFFEYCYKHHIDFLGLIKMGLAIDATNLNIY